MPTFWEKLLTRLTICYLCVLSTCNFSIGFGGWIWVLIASVPDLCIHVLPLKPLVNKVKFTWSHLEKVEQTKCRVNCRGHMSKTVARLLYDKTRQNQKQDDLENLNGESGSRVLTIKVTLA